MPARIRVLRRCRVYRHARPSRRTNQSRHREQRPGARFEFLESLSPERRPTHFRRTTPRGSAPRSTRRDVAHTTLRPGLPHQRCRLVGEGDIASDRRELGITRTPASAAQRSHRAGRSSNRVEHLRHGERARASLARPDSVADTSAVPRALVDGRTRGPRTRARVSTDGRTIRRARWRTLHDSRSITYEAAANRAPHRRPTGVVVSRSDRPSPITLTCSPGFLRRSSVTSRSHRLRVSSTRFAFNIPDPRVAPARGRVRTEATAPYRVFHWFVLQPVAATPPPSRVSALNRPLTVTPAEVGVATGATRRCRVARCNTNAPNARRDETRGWRWRWWSWLHRDQRQHDRHQRLDDLAGYERIARQRAKVVDSDRGDVPRPKQRSASWA